MIVVEQKTWWRQLTVWRGTAIQRIWIRLVLVTAAATLMTAAHRRWGIDLAILTPLPFSLIGVALGIFLGFRNNASYDRFWEGRKLWGELVNTSRTWVRQVLMLIDRAADEPAPGSRHRELVHGAIAFAHLVRAHLRDERRTTDADALLPPDARERIMAASHRPLAVLGWLGDRIRQARLDRVVDPLHVPLLETTLGAFTNIMGACERIKSTPIPASYSVLIHRIVAVYVFTLPLGLLDATGAYTPEVVLLIAYAFLGLDAIGDELENPFGFDANDLPLTALTRNIEIDLRACLGERELPPSIEATHGILS